MFFSSAKRTLKEVIKNHLRCGFQKGHLIFSHGLRIGAVNNATIFAIFGTVNMIMMSNKLAIGDWTIRQSIANIAYAIL